MLHYTTPERADAILVEGLRTGRVPELTDDAAWTIDYYEVNPVFLTKPDSDFISVLREDAWADHSAIKVDVKGLALVADLACLVDHGARHDGEGYLYWTPSRIPDAMRPYIDHDGAIEIEFLLDPETDACRAAIALTGTAACTSDIPASRLALAPAAPGMSP